MVEAGIEAIAALVGMHAVPLVVCQLEASPPGPMVLQRLSREVRRKPQRGTGASEGAKEVVSFEPISRESSAPRLLHVELLASGQVRDST